MDIVERLRRALVVDPTYGPSVRLSLDYEDIKEAADHIEALREALKEIERISASQMNGSLYPDDASGWSVAFDDAVDVARAALKDRTNEAR